VHPGAGGHGPTTPPSGCWGANALRTQVDAQCNQPAIAVAPASIQDRSTLPALDTGKAAGPSLRPVVFDRAFAAERCREWSNQHACTTTVSGAIPTGRASS
jgi:hypothetical protein